MTQGYRKLFHQILRGRADAAIRFADLLTLLRALGFEMSVRGSHHIFSKYGLREVITLQPDGSLAKPYQVRQVRKLILKYRLELGDE